MNMDTIIETKNLTKKFGNFTANDHIDLAVKEGEIRAIIGENGAGKSTLMNMLYGILQPTEGEILFRGKKVAIASPRDAIELGIGMVHQHFKLSPSLSIPVAVGSGVTEKNIAEKMQIADILIIGTTLRRNGSMAEPIDEAQARALLRAAGREV